MSNCLFNILVSLSTTLIVMKIIDKFFGILYFMIIGNVMVDITVHFESISIGSKTAAIPNRPT